MLGCYMSGKDFRQQGSLRTKLSSLLKTYSVSLLQNLTPLNLRLIGPRGLNFMSPNVQA